MDNTSLYKTDGRSKKKQQNCGKNKGDFKKHSRKTEHKRPHIQGSRVLRISVEKIGKNNK